MNPTQNTGSFGAPAGGMTDALQQVFQQVQSGQYKLPATSQVTNGAPNAMNSPQPPTPTPVGTPTPPMGMGAPQQAPASPTMPFDSSEAKMIIQALTTRLKHNSKLEESALPTSSF